MLFCAASARCSVVHLGVGSWLDLWSDLDGLWTIGEGCVEVRTYVHDAQCYDSECV
jgi:hypothetical protein